MMDERSAVHSKSVKEHPINEDIDKIIPDINKSSDKVWPADDEVLEHQLDDNDDLHLDLGGPDFDPGFDLGFGGPGASLRPLPSAPRMMRQPVPSLSSGRPPAAAFSGDIWDLPLDNGFHDSHFDERKGEYVKTARERFLNAPGKAERQSDTSAKKWKGGSRRYDDNKSRPMAPESTSAATAFDEVDALIMRYTNVGGEELRGSRLGNNEGEE